MSEVVQKYYDCGCALLITGERVRCPTCTANLSAGSCGHFCEACARRDDRIKELEKQLAERDAALARCVEILKTAECPECHGVGLTIEEWTDTVAECCGRPTRSGDCCGYPIPAPELRQEQRQCQWCAYKADVLASLHASAQATAKVQQWQPIETAPKDGTNILLVNRAGNVATGLWQGNGEYEGWWLRGGNRPNAFFNHHYGPSYWMPLPEPPTEAIREEKETK